MIPNFYNIPDSLTILIAFTGPMLLTNMSVWITVGLTVKKHMKGLVIFYKVTSFKQVNINSSNYVPFHRDNDSK